VRRAVRKLSGTVLHKAFHDINIFIESAEPSWFPHARINCLLPNQEWVGEDTIPFLPKFDWIFCKTRHAEGIFSRRGYRTRYVGFTSVDRFDAGVAHAYDSFVHIAGTSMLKGTEALVKCWLDHPEWPRLKILWHAAGIAPTYAPNIEWITISVDDGKLRRIQNMHGVHFCPSAVEGFGHSIVEAMSCKALVIVTDAPPMNEIVRPERGILVPYSQEWAIGFGTGFNVDGAAIEKAVDFLGQMSPAQREQMAENARLWYLENDRLFRERIVAAVRDSAV